MNALLTHIRTGAPWALLLAFTATALGACVSAEPGRQSYVLMDSVVVDAPFDEAWQLTKDALREGDFQIYTRDKRGHFLAYSDTRRSFIIPKRTQFAINLESVTSDSTRITIETARQEYGVTLLTYPGWRDRPTEDNSAARALLETVKDKAGGGGDITALDPTA